MQAARVILDFPGPRRNQERLEPGPPRRIISAAHLSEVRPALREAERAAADGCWVAGFVAYEAAPAFDPALVTRPHEGPAPLLWFGVFDAPPVVRALARASARADAVADEQQMATRQYPQEMPSAARLELIPPMWECDASRAGYDAAIAQIRERIAAGDVYQVNHTLRFSASCDLDPAALYDALVAARHGRYHALIETAEWAVVSASPELFIDVRDGVITTSPMKGTARRGRWPADDDALAEYLAHSAKDRAENLMIVDLLRNDIGRIARFGTVEVRDMYAVETYPTVHQMTSTISARLRDRVTLDDIFAATFPCGSVTGAPKVAAMQQIAGLEHTARGPYCGAIGVLRPDGTATFNVGIRTLVIDRTKRTAVYGAGGGITWDSSAQAEYDEAVAKTALLWESAVPTFHLLETMRLQDGEICRLDLHLERLTASARYWAFDNDAPRRAAAALKRVAADTPAGVWRVRMTVSRDAQVSVALVQMDDEPGTRPDGAQSYDRIEGASGEADREAGVGRDASLHSPAGPRHIVVLANEPIDSGDRLLYHKTTARAVYDERRAAHSDAFDVLLHNEHGCITEFTIGNVVCDIDGALVTPPRAAGLLGGTFREQLLRSGVVREADVRVADLSRVTRMWLVNSVREWVPVRLELAPGALAVD